MNLIKWAIGRLRSLATTPANGRLGDIGFVVDADVPKVYTSAGWTSLDTGSGITNSAGANVVPKSDGTNLVASSLSDNGSAISTTSAITQTSASATAFESGPNGATNPVLRLVNSTASQADGISITGGAAGAGTTIAALSSGSNSPIILTPKGTGSVVFPGGAVATPAIRGADTNSGIFFSGNNTRFTMDGVEMAVVAGGGFSLRSDSEFGISSTSSASGAADVLWGRAGAANFRHGSVDAASPVAQTLSVQGSRSGTDTNVAGANLTIKSGTGTGNSTGSSLIFQTPVAVASGTGAQTQTSTLTLQGGNATFSGNGTFSGTLASNGDLTIATAKLLSIASGTNQRAGNATLVNGTVTVSNTTITANTIVILSRKTVGGTLGAGGYAYTLSAGTSFTINAVDLAGVLSAFDTSVLSYVLIEVP